MSTTQLGWAKDMNYQDAGKSFENAWTIFLEVIFERALNHNFTLYSKLKLNQADPKN